MGNLEILNVDNSQDATRPSLVSYMWQSTNGPLRRESRGAREWEVRVLDKTSFDSERFGLRGRSRMHKGAGEHLLEFCTHVPAGSHTHSNPIRHGSSGHEMQSNDEQQLAIMTTTSRPSNTLSTIIGPVVSELCLGQSPTSILPYLVIPERALASCRSKS